MIDEFNENKKKTIIMNSKSFLILGTSQTLRSSTKVQMGLSQSQQRWRDNGDSQQRQRRIDRFSTTEQLDWLCCRNGTSTLVSSLGDMQLVSRIADLGAAFQVQTL